MLSSRLKAFKNFKIIKSLSNEKLPLFSLRSNSIESRFRSIRGAIFANLVVTLKKSKATRNSLRS
jgi:hypothetical protein